ncbi:MAG: rhomboid family intramembrane serine protease [Bradymonadia bacterium]
MSSNNRSPSRWYLLVLYWYFRLTGASKTQAEWRVRDAVNQPRKAARRILEAGSRVNESRFNCVCGQLLTPAEKRCGKCGRRQYMPHVFRVLERTLKRAFPGGRVATVVLMIIIAFGYLLQLKFDGEAGGSLGGFPWSLYALGAAFPDLLLNGQLWRSVSYSWLHGGAWHIIMNTIVIVQIAPLAEQFYGSARVFLAWWVSAIAGAVIPVALFGLKAPVIGASGSAFGIMGMALVFGHRLGTPEGKSLRDTMIFWAVFSTVIGSTGGMNVAHGAHFSGLFAGILLSVVLPPPTTASRKRLNAPIALVATLIFAWGGLSTAQWLSSDMRPPKELPTLSQARYLYGIGQIKGDADVLGSEVSEFLEEVREFTRGRTASVEQSLITRKDELTNTLSPAQKLLFEQRLAEVLEAVP